MKISSRKTASFVLGVLCLFFVTYANGANPDSVVIPGDLRIEGLGNALVFPNGSMQYSAAETGPAGPPNSLSIGTVTTGAPGTNAQASITGNPPSQTLNLTIPQGAAGTPGVCGSLQYLLHHTTILYSYPATATTNAYLNTMHLTILRDTTGIETGWINEFVTGSASSPTSAYPRISFVYNTEYDSHNNATGGYIYTNPASSVPGGTPDRNNTFTFTEAHTYDGNGNRTQRVRTWYSNGTAFRIQTTNLGAHGSYLLETNSYPGSGALYTDTYSNISFDHNGYPKFANITTTDSSGAVTSTGFAIYDFEQRCSGP